MVEGVRDGEEIPVREVVAERRDLVQRIRDLRHAIPRRMVLEPGRLVVGIRDRDDVPRGVILEAGRAAQGINALHHLIDRIADSGGRLAERIGLAEKDISIGGPHNQPPMDFEMKEDTGVRVIVHETNIPIVPVI